MDKKQLLEKLEKFQELPTDQKWFVIEVALKEVLGIKKKVKK